MHMRKITLLFIGIFISIISAYSNENFALQSLNNNTSYENNIIKGEINQNQKCDKPENFLDLINSKI